MQTKPSLNATTAAVVLQVETNVQRNGVLNAMSNADLALLQPHLEAVPLKFRQRLQSSNRSIRDVYFPDSGIASVVAVAGNERRQAEVAIIGREGMSGLAVVHGADRSPCDVFMQVEGTGHRITAQKLQETIDQSITLLRCLLRYATPSGYKPTILPWPTRAAISEKDWPAGCLWPVIGSTATRCCSRMSFSRSPEQRKL